MQRIEKFIMVSAPTSAIFGFINEPMNLTKIWPGMIEVTDVRSLNNGGRSFQCVSRMVGARIQYIYECIEYDFNRCITSKISGGLHGWVKWLVEASVLLANLKVEMEKQNLSQKGGAIC